MKVRMVPCLLLVFGFSVATAAAQDSQLRPYRNSNSSNYSSPAIITATDEEPMMIYIHKKDPPTLPNTNTSSKDEPQRKNTLPETAAAATTCGDGGCSSCSSCSSFCGCKSCPYPPGRVWFGADFLLWWTRGDHLPPLVTTSPPGTPETMAGVLGQPGTSVLFGDQSVNGGVRPGLRLTAGGWFNDAHTTGIEANFIYLGTEVTHFSAASDGIPILARPFVFEDPTDPRFGQNGSLKIAFPGLVRGNIDINASSSFLTTDVYIRQALCCGCCCRLDGLIGYRYARLRDTLEISETEIATNPASAAFGIPFLINEGFETRNEFNGGEIGLIGEYMCNCWIFRGWAKIAFGTTQREVDIHGTTQVGNNPPQNGGFLALPSNIGSFDSSVFSVLPEVGVELGYAITPRFRVFTGFTFLYWSGVARPGEQVDLHVNASQPPLGTGLVGQPLPAFSFHSSDFWAMGLNLGVELRF